MTSRTVLFHPGVEDDLAAIRDHYASVDAALPARFEVRAHEQVERLELFPESGLVLFESYRRLLLKRFPYMLVYRVTSSQVHVLAILNVKRDPRGIVQTIASRTAGPEAPAT